MDEDSIGFSAKTPVSAWNKRIGVDTPGLFRAALKGALAYFTGNAPGAIGAAIDATAAFKLRPLPPAELAWLLIQRAMARAMVELTVEAAQRHGADLGDKDGLVATLDGALDATEIWIDPAFFDRPADSPIIGAVQAPFTEWLANLGLSQAEAASVLPRLGAYFTFALRREWARDAEAYSAIDTEIAKYENRFAGADERERAWLRNAAYLERQINEPVFEESFGLAQIYVPLRAWYREAPASLEGRGPDEGRHVVDLERHLDAWLTSGDKKDAIRVISGGPGSGKSSFAKIWAAKLAEQHHLLFIPLHRLELRDERPDVQAALWEFLRDLDVLPVDPLDSSDGERRLLILFDGLDELAMQGRAGQEAARSFVEAVERKLDLLNARSDRFVQVAFGGREIAVQSARLSSHQVLHVLPYHGAGRDFEDPEKLLKANRYACQRWWQQFGEAVGANYGGVPKTLQGEDLAEITAQPLLNYLLALSYRRGKLDFSGTPNLNRIYGDLLDAVYERRWGPGQHPTRKQLTRQEFDDLLDELGLAAWHGAGRTVTETQVEAACERAGLQQQLATFKEGARSGAISLLAAFYFRQAGKIEGERTFEFTHKSFGEYLIARRFMRAMEDINAQREENRRNRRRGLTEEQALGQWVELAGPAALDKEVLAFLRREVALQERDLVTRWRASFTELFNDQLTHRLPMHTLQVTFREMSVRARNAEETLFAAVHACAVAVNESGEKPEHSKIAWPHRFALRDLQARLSEGRFRGLASHDCLTLLEAARQDLNGASLWATNLSRANLYGAGLRETDLEWADLSEANLCEANLTKANLRKANLSEANLSEANLGEANLRGANLRGANLEGANGLDEVEGWQGAKIERKWVERLGLDAEELALEVVDDIDPE